MYALIYINNTINYNENTPLYIINPNIIVKVDAGGFYVEKEIQRTISLN
jgi:hypothetical protein